MTDVYQNILRQIMPYTLIWRGGEPSGVFPVRASMEYSGLGLWLFLSLNDMPGAGVLYGTVYAHLSKNLQHTFVYVMLCHGYIDIHCTYIVA